MKINCLSCGFKVDLSDAYDNYEGQVRCFVCNAVLEIKTEDAQIKAVRLTNTAGHGPVRDMPSPLGLEHLPGGEPRS